MSFPTYFTEHLYSPDMEHCPDGRAVRLWFDRQAAADAVATARSLVPHAEARIQGKPLAKGERMARRVFVDDMRFAGATDWYRTDEEADEEARVEMRKRRIPFTAVVVQSGTVMD